MEEAAIDIYMFSESRGERPLHVNEKALPCHGDIPEELIERP